MQATAAQSGPSEHAEALTPLFLRAHRPASCSSGSSRPDSRSRSRPATPKWLPPALEQKLQHYRDNPAALGELNQLLKQFSRPFIPRKTPTTAAPALRPVAPWALSAHHSQDSSRASTAPNSPQSGKASRQKTTEILQITHGAYERSGSAEHADLQECLTEDPQQACCAGQQPGPCNTVPHTTSTSTEFNPQQQSQHAAGQHPEQQQLHESPAETVAPLLDAVQAAEGPLQPCSADSSDVQDPQHNHTLLDLIPEEQQDACQPSSGSSGCDAALQLQQLLEEQEQQEQQQLADFDHPPEHQPQQHLAQDQIWQQLQAARLHPQATVIQRSVKRTRCTG